MNDLKRRDRIRVEKDGENIEVFNWLNVKVPASLRVGEVEQFEPRIGAGDSTMKPDYITQWIAEELLDEYGVRAENHDIEVIDIESDDVQVYH